MYKMLSLSVLVLVGCADVSESAIDVDGSYRITGRLNLAEISCPGQSLNLLGHMRVENGAPVPVLEYNCRAETSDGLLTLVCPDRSTHIAYEFTTEGVSGTRTVERVSCSYTYEFTGTKEP